MTNADSLLHETETFVPSAPTPNGSTADEDRPDLKPMARGRRGRGLIRYAAFAVVGIAVVIAASLYDPRKLFDSQDSAAVTEARDTSLVRVTDLAEEHGADGNLIFSDITAAAHLGAPGIVTEIFPPATGIESGQVLWRINNEPTVALSGDIPMYRDLGVDDVGPDVAQLEANLVALGYDAEETVTIDETFTSNTALMVERWQEDIGAAVTGSVRRGAVLFINGPAHTGVVHAALGDSITTEAAMLSHSSLTRILEFSVQASERESIAVGDAVSARLPDRSTISATVTGVVILADGSVSVVAEFSDAVDYVVDTVPVAVSWQVPSGTNVLTVPAAALLRTDTGNHFVEVVEPDGATGFVRVETGRSSGSTVEIVGDVAEGDTVIAP